MGRWGPVRLPVGGTSRWGTPLSGAATAAVAGTTAGRGGAAVITGEGEEEARDLVRRRRMGGGRWGGTRGGQAESMAERPSTPDPTEQCRLATRCSPSQSPSPLVMCPLGRPTPGGAAAAAAGTNGADQGGGVVAWTAGVGGGCRAMRRHPPLLLRSPGYSVGGRDVHRISEVFDYLSTKYPAIRSLEGGGDDGGIPLRSGIPRGGVRAAAARPGRRRRRGPPPTPPARHRRRRGAIAAKSPRHRLSRRRGDRQKRTFRALAPKHGRRRTRVGQRTAARGFWVRTSSEDI